MAQCLIMHRVILIRLASPQDDTLCDTAPSNAIPYEIPPGFGLAVRQLAITRSRVMIRAEAQCGGHRTGTKDSCMGCENRRFGEQAVVWE